MRSRALSAASRFGLRIQFTAVAVIHYIYAVRRLRLRQVVTSIADNYHPTPPKSTPNPSRGRRWFPTTP